MPLSLRFTRILQHAAVASVLMLFGAGCSREPGITGELNREFTDLTGRKIALAPNVKRIVLPRSKDIYLLLALLGDELPDRLVAWGPDLKKDDSELYRSVVKRYPPLAGIPLTGSVYDDGLSTEQLLSWNPDLVILDKFMLDRGYRYPAKLDAAGLPVVYLRGSDDPFTGPQHGIELLGRILGKEQKAEAIVQFIEARLRMVQSRVESASTRPTVYLEQGYRGPGTYADTYGCPAPPGKPTSWGMILQSLKVQNVAGSFPVQQAPIQPEFLLKANPEIIVITGQNWTNSGAMRLGLEVERTEALGLLQAYLSRPGWENLAAVKSQRVCAVFHNTAAITAFAGIEALAKACYPEQFADIDPERDLQEFFQRFLPIPYSGTWVCDLSHGSTTASSLTTIQSPSPAP